MGHIKQSHARTSHTSLYTPPSHALFLMSHFLIAHTFHTPNPHTTQWLASPTATRTVASVCLSTADAAPATPRSAATDAAAALEHTKQSHARSSRISLYTPPSQATFFTHFLIAHTFHTPNASIQWLASPSATRTIASVCLSTADAAPSTPRTAAAHAAAALEHTKQYAQDLFPLPVSACHVVSEPVATVEPCGVSADGAGMVLTSECMGEGGMPARQEEEGEVISAQSAAVEKGNRRPKTVARKKSVGA